MEQKKAYSACDFLRWNLLILINSSSKVAEWYNHCIDMEKGGGWLLKTPQKKDNAGISLWECWFVPCLKPQDHTHFKIFLFLLAFQGTHCCLFASVWLPNCGLMAFCLRPLQKRGETSSEPQYCWRLQGTVQTHLILDISLRPLGVSF